jgi:LysR family hydrogen peroxide-inducible transcriptional activator
MELQYVRYFLALCEEHHFGKAAKRCGITQPSLTNAIKRFEASFGGALFIRWPSVEPTSLALAIKPDLERILLLAERAKLKADQLIRTKS